MLNSITTQPKCPSCGKPKMVTDENSGELFCAGCGFVINEKLEDTGAEWRTFSNEASNRTRVGAEILNRFVLEFLLLPRLVLNQSLKGINTTS